MFVILKCDETKYVITADDGNIDGRFALIGARVYGHIPLDVIFCISHQNGLACFLHRFKNATWFRLERRDG